MLLRNGEQLLLTVIIPTLLLVLFGAVDIVDTGEGLAGRLPGARHPGAGRAVHGLHRAGHRHRLRAPLRRAQAAGRLSAAPLGADDREDLLRAGHRSPPGVLLTAVAFALGWSPHGNPPRWLLLLLLGTAAFSGLGLLMAGTLKAEATLAGANLVFLLLLVGGGVIVPLDKFPDAAQTCSGCCRSRRCRTGCATCSSTAPAFRGGTGDPRGLGGARAGRRGPVLPLGVRRPAQAPQREDVLAGPS